MNLTGFKVEYEKCIHCGRCILTCTGGLLSFNEDKEIQIKEVTEFGWGGCWKCQHCLAVCPQGAISILRRKPEDSLSPVKPDKTSDVIDRLIVNRRSCRRYLDKNVDKECIEGMLQILQNAPTGSNKQLVEYTLLDEKDQTAYFRNIAYEKMDELARQGIYPTTFDAHYYGQMKGWEATVRPDMLFCGAPHLLIPHVPKKIASGIQDANIACAYFELLCASRGLGAVLMSFPLDVLENMAEIKAMLEIPEDHYIPLIIGFGYPEILYARGVQRQEDDRVHRLRFTSKLTEGKR